MRCTYSLLRKLISLVLALMMVVGMMGIALANDNADNPPAGGDQPAASTKGSIIVKPSPTVPLTDKTLKAYFESDEAMEGIFAWLVQGYNKYRKYGLGMPETMKPVMRAYAKDNDVVLQFLEDRCETAEGERIKAKTLYDAYKSWCRSCGYYVCSLKRFIAEVVTHPEWYEYKGMSNGATAFSGLKLKEV